MSTTLQKKVQGRERPGTADNVAVSPRHRPRHRVGKLRSEKKHRKKSIRVKCVRRRAPFRHDTGGAPEDAGTGPPRRSSASPRSRFFRTAKPRTARISEPRPHRDRTPTASRDTRNPTARVDRCELSGARKHTGRPKAAGVETTVATRPQWPSSSSSWE